MAELGLLATCIGLVDYSLKLISKARELRQKYKDFYSVVSLLETQLGSLESSLQSIKVQSDAKRLSVETEQRLLDVIHKIRKEIEFIDKKVSGATQSTLKRISFEKDISGAVKNVQDYIQILILHNSHVSTGLGFDILSHIQKMGRAPSPMTLQSKTLEAMHEAARQGDVTILKNLSNSGANMNAMDAYGRRPLHTAAYYRKMDAVDLLCRVDVMVDAIDNDGKTPLHIALQRGNVKIARYLSERGASITILDAARKTPEDYARANLLTLWGFRHGSGINRRDPKNGNTLLIAAAVQGEGELVRKLLEMGSDVNSENHFRSTALIEACIRGHGDVITALLDAGADVNRVDAIGYSAFTRTIWAGRENAMKQLLESDKSKVDIHATNTRRKHTAIAECAHQHQWTMMKLLLKHGADVNDVDHKGCRMLQRAVEQCQDTRLMKVLLSHGADPESAMQEAVKRKFQYPMKVLLEHGANANGKIEHYPYISWLTKEGSSWELVKLLITHKADINAVNKDGWSALSEALYHGHVVHARGLLGEGADPHKFEGGNSARMNGRPTLLMFAAISRKVAWNKVLVYELIAHGAKVNSQDSKGWTALHWAVERGHNDAACALLLRGANPSIKDQDSLTAVDRAAPNKAKLVKFLSMIETMESL